MKIYCNRNELNKAINNLSHAVPTRTTSNILEGILVEVENGLMKMTTTDTTITIESVLNVNCNESCSFVVPAKLFGNIINKLYEEEIMLDYESSKLNIISAGSNSELVCFNAEEFPKIKLDEGNNQINLSKENVKKLVRKTAFSASTDDFNGILTGVLLQIKDKNMKMVGVDPFRIAICNIEIENNLDIEVVIPAKLINEVSKIMSDDGDDNLLIEIIDNKVLFKFDNYKVIINTYSGKFIDYERIINKQGEINVRIKRSELLSSIDRASLLTSVQNNNLIKFNINENVLIINSLSEEGNIEEKLEIIKDGENLQIGLNAKYLKDALSVIEDEEISINFKDSVSPCIIKPLVGNKYTYLVLPIRIN